MRKVCSLPSQEMSLSNQGCPLPRRMSVRVTFHVKNESLSPLCIECDCTGIADLVSRACYPMFGGWFFMISFFTPDGSLAESLGEILLHIVIGNDATNLHNTI